MTKKIFSIIWMLMLVLSASVQTAEIASGSEESVFADVDEYKKQILLSFDIYAMPNSDGYITNGEFAKSILRAMKLYNGESDSASVQKLKSGGIVPSQLSFSTPEILKVSDACKVVLEALGYGTVADYIGYERYIYDLDLNDGMSGNDLMDEADCVALLYNMLITPVYSISSISDNESFTFAQGDVFAKVYHDAAFIRGTVVATEFAAISGYEQYMKESLVCIDSTYFDAQDTDIADQLAKEVEIFGLKSGSNSYRVCGYVVTDDASEIVVPLKDVLNVSGFLPSDPIGDRAAPVIEYDDLDHARTVCKKMSSSVKVVYNGMQSIDITNSDFLGETGYVSLRDYDGDRVFDVAHIVRYVPARVLTLDTIYKKLVLDNGTSIDYSQADLIEVIHSGRVVDMSAVCIGTMVGVYEPKAYSESVSERIRIEIFSNIKNGIVSSIDTRSFIVGINEEYFSFLPSLAQKIILGNKYDFVLDSKGVAVYVTDRGQGGEYIYYLQHKVDNGLNPGLKVQAVDMNSEYKIYDVCDNVRYTGPDQNGIWVNEKNLRESELIALMDTLYTGHTLIKARFRGGELAEIITAQDMSANDYKGYTTDLFTMDYSFTNGDYARRTDRLGLNHKAISGTTIVVMDDLSESRDGVEVVRYSAVNSAVVSEESYYMENAYIYDSNNELEVGVFVMTYDPEKNEILNAAGSAVLYQATAMLVDEVTMALNFEGDETYKVHGYMDGNRVSYIAKDDEVTQRYRTSWFDRHCRFVNELKFGDVIVPTINSKGEMSEFYLLASPDDPTTPITYIEPTNSSSNTAYGKVTNNYDNIVVRLECAPERLFLMTDSPIHYVCDMSEQKIYLSNGTQHIQDMTSANPDHMFILRWGLYTKQIVLYRR